MTLIPTPTPAHLEHDLDALFIQAINQPLDSDVARKALNGCWTAAEYHGIERIFTTINPTEHPDLIDPIAQAIKLCHGMTHRQVEWTWVPSDNPTMIDGIIHIPGVITIWHASEDTPLYLVAPLVYTRDPEDQVRASTGPLPGTLIFGTPGSYRIHTYTGHVVTQLAIRVLPHLICNTYLLTATIAAHAWQTHAPMTVINLVQQLPTLTNVDAANMASLTELVVNLTNDQEQAMAFVEILPFDLSTPATFNAHADRVISWSKAGGDPVRYITDVIRPCLVDNPDVDLLDAIRRAYRSVCGCETPETSSPPWEDVAETWNAYHITRIQFPQLRALLISIIGRLLDAIRRASPDLFANGSSIPTSQITWDAARTLATAIDAEIYRQDGYVHIILIRDKQTIIEISKILRDWPFYRTNDEITNLTMIRIPLAEEPPCGD